MTIETSDYEQWISNPFTQVFLKFFEDHSLSIVENISHSDISTVDSVLELCRNRGKLHVLEKLTELFNDEKYCLDTIKEIYGE